MDSSIEIKITHLFAISQSQSLSVSEVLGPIYIKGQCEGECFRHSDVHHDIHHKALI